MTTLVGFGTLFCCLAGIIAGLVTYDEYQHHYSDRNQARRAAVSVASFAFAFFFIASVGAMMFFLRVLGPGQP